ncbi:unnamed protein product [Peniophora sp. CBMAI 1063]|nr:unnamed protein product [Peniophora sp. CBMAI 1063]
MSHKPSFPNHQVHLQLSDVRLSDHHGLQRLPNLGQFTFTIIKVFEPVTQAVVVLARCDAVSASPVVIKIYDPRYLTNRFKNHYTNSHPRPWTLDAEAAVGLNPVPLSELERGVPLELREPEPTSADGQRHRAARWELHFQTQSRQSFEAEYKAYTRLADLQGSVVPRVLGVGRQVFPSEPRFYQPRALVFEFIEGITIESAPSTVVTPQLIAQLYQDIRLFAPRGVVHGDLRWSNVILSPAQSPKRAVVIDFGQARVREDETDKDWEEVVSECDEPGAVASMLMEKDITWHPSFMIPPYGTSVPIPGLSHSRSTA